ncbi:MAG: hypothetical protein RL748_1942 [Pseudomonadota bacterium]|jgi:hypothetical protein
MIRSEPLSHPTAALTAERGSDDVFLSWPLPLATLSATLQRCGLDVPGSQEERQRYLVGAQQLAYWLANQRLEHRHPPASPKIFKRAHLAEFSHGSRLAGRLSWAQYRGY